MMRRYGMALLFMAMAVANGCSSPMDIDTARRRFPEDPVQAARPVRFRPKNISMSVFDMLKTNNIEYVPIVIDIEIDTSYAQPHLYIHRFEARANPMWPDQLHSFRFHCDSLILNGGAVTITQPISSPYGMEITGYIDTNGNMKTISADTNVNGGTISCVSRSGKPGCMLEVYVQAYDADFVGTGYFYKAKIEMEY